MTPEIKNISPGLAKGDREEEPEIKTIHPYLVKVDGEVEGEIDTVFAYQDGTVGFLLVPLPLQQMLDPTDRTFAPDKLAKANDPMLKDGECEVEMRLKFPGMDEPRSVCKRKAKRTPTNMAGGWEGGNLHAHVQLHSFDPPLKRDEVTKRLR